MKKYEEDTADEVANAVAREYGNDNSQDQDEVSSQDKISLDEDEIEDVTTNRFSVKSPQDLEDVLSSLERYCFDTDSANLPLIYKLRSNFANEKIQAAAARQRSLNQSTLDSFVVFE